MLESWNLLGLVLIGFSVGLIGGCLGIGGAWIVTPALNILGYPMPIAIGTDIVHMATKSSVGVWKHRKLGNIDFFLGFFIVIGSLIGLHYGSNLLIYLHQINSSIDSIIRLIYVMLLLLISLTILFDILKLRKQSEKIPRVPTGKKNISRFFSLPPFIFFTKSNITCSIWSAILPSIAIGFTCSFLGIGGGLLRLPFFLYYLKCPLRTAIGTDLFVIFVFSIFGSIKYSLNHLVDFSAVLIMLPLSMIGANLGATVTKYLTDMALKTLFFIAATLCLCSVILKQLQMHLLSTAIIYSFCIFSSIYILKVLHKNIRLSSVKIKN